MDADCMILDLDQIYLEISDMCGICLLLTVRENVLDEKLPSDLSSNLKRRGPDHFHEIKLLRKESLELNFVSSVLHLRGSVVESQPVQDEKGNILLWNGEIFDGPLLQSAQSDTKILSEKLFHCTQIDDVLCVLGSIRGPYAFIFFQTNCELLWFGRDIFGRRSLLMNTDGISLKLCSVAYGDEIWQEVPSTGIFCLDLNQCQERNCFISYHFPWLTTASGLSPCKDNTISIPHLTVHNKSNISINSPIPRSLNRSLPSEEVINCCFKSLITDSDSELNKLSSLLENDMFKTVLVNFEEVLSEAVKKRVQNQPYLCKKCFNFDSLCDSILNCNHASLGILFSGGLDSIVIAALAHRHLPLNIPIDLLNVAFGNKVNDFSNKDHSAFNTPDRLTGRNGASVLSKLYPSRLWNFIEIDVSKEELVSQRKTRISQLLKPSHTVLDDSIGCAIWFAARGEGVIAAEKGCTSYISPVRVLLVGMGADEQLGGYSRHRAKFNNLGWSGLIEELSLEIDRIGSRNLGRDDRIIADNSVESRYPFLDENVVSFLNDLPVWLKMNLNLPRGLGEKLLLRLIAYKIGLTEAAILPKRAIQFGSRIARIENTKEKGSDICERLKETL